MIVLVTLKWKPKAFGGVGDDEFRCLRRRCGLKRLQKRFHAVPAKLGHEAGKVFIGEGVDQIERPFGPGHVLMEPGAPGSPALIAQRRIEGVGAIIDPFLQARATGPGKCLALTLAIFEGQNLPARRLEDVVEAVKHAFGGRRIQALTIIVHDPPAIADVVLVALDQGLIDIALIKLCISHEGDEPARVFLGELTPTKEHVLHQRGKGRDCHPKAH